MYNLFGKKVTYNWFIISSTQSNLSYLQKTTNKKQR
jgi:hypothetical protein